MRRIKREKKRDGERGSMYKRGKREEEEREKRGSMCEQEKRAIERGGVCYREKRERGGENTVNFVSFKTKQGEIGLLHI